MKKRMVLAMALLLGAFTLSGCGVKVTPPSISFNEDEDKDDADDEDDEDFDEEDLDDSYDEDFDDEDDDDDFDDDETDFDSDSDDQGYEYVQIKESPDKYTWYMQNYVGKNLASCGYTSMGGERMDTYGTGYIQLNLITDDGSFIDINDEAELQQYVVAAQSYEPNEEIKFTFETDEDGEEYDYLVLWQNIDQIDLLVKKVNQDLNPSAPELIATTPSPDRYTYYLHNYVGRNLAMTGYTSLAGNRMDEYGTSHIELVLVTDDGSYIDLEDQETMKSYVVTGQDTPADTQFTCTYMTDPDGNEYSNLVENQSIEKITLYLSKL